MDQDEAIQDFLGERPHADQLRGWRETLEHRLQSLVENRARGTADADAALEAKIAGLKRQIAALGQEEAITQFVEDSVRVTLAMGSLHEGHEGINGLEE
jgi:hypothetical protein